MLHFGFLAIRTDVFVLLLCLMVALFQAFLCLKAKKKIVRFMPVYLTLVLTTVFTAFGFLFDGWDGFGFFFIAACSAVLLTGSGIGWGIWAILKKIKFGKRG